MKNYLYILLSLFSLLFSCDNREWNNPFDADCPREIWTPINFTAVQQGSSIKLTWNQSVNNISDFHIERTVGDTGEDWASFTIDKNSYSWIDTDITGGEVHTYRIFAVAGNNMSNDQSMQITPLFTATLSTSFASMITSTTALLGGTITSNGGALVTERGICWATSENPTIGNNKFVIGKGSGNFSNIITGLLPITKYYYRAYAINSQGTSYGNLENFTTLEDRSMPPGISTTITDIDGNEYKVVTIGTQVWMAENLKVTRYNDGTSIPNVTNNDSWVNLTSGAFCFYNNDAESYKNIYGALYNWYAVNTNKLAPIGWHVPTDAEWINLVDFLGGQSVADIKLKESGTAHWQGQNIGATNDTGFTALPGGCLGSIFNSIGYGGYWWCSTEYDASNGWYRLLKNYPDNVVRNATGKGLGFSIRCIKD